jgi:hypothetical protein
MKNALTGAFLVLTITTMAQDSTKSQDSPISFTGFAEAYYSYDFNKPANNNRPFFLYSHNRHNEFNINLAYVKGSYSTERTRSNIALAVGTYMNANYIAEPGVLKNIYEANVGAKISKNKNLWLDVGVLPSHIGFESARSSDCWTLTRSILAENSPYFESGARISYTSDNSKWFVSALALNGWQRITRVSGNSLMSWGTQLTFKPSDKITVNYSSFIGTDKPDSSRQWRYFHNSYGIFQLTSKLGLTLGFDFGQEQASKGNSKLYTWYSPGVILRVTPNSNWAMALRGEYYCDKNGVIISTGTVNGFQTVGFSFNVDRSIGDHFLWRTELRTLNSKDKIFGEDNGLLNTNPAITTSFALSF